MKTTKPLRNNAILVGIGLALYLAGTCLLKNSYYQLIFTLVPIWAMMGIAWNLISGYTGLVSFGHAAFFGLGAFTVTLLFVDLGISPWFGLIGAGAIGALAGLLIGLPTFRLRGLYFALAMLAYPLVLLYLFNWLGLNEITLPMQHVQPWKSMQFSDQRVYILIGIVLLALSLWVNLWVARSRFGLSLLAIKQNELATQAAGINPFVWKLKALSLSGAIAGVAGGFYAVVMLIVTPVSVFGLLVSAQAMIVALFGGAANLAGPLVGAVVLIPLGEILNAQFGNRWPGIQGVVYGLAIILVVLIAPQGILPKLGNLLRRKRAAPPAAPLDLDHEPYMHGRTGTDAPMGEILLSVRGLSKSFGGVVAVREVSFEVYRGEILGIIGPNGAGKTTLFNLLNGVIPPTGGHVEFEDKSLDRLPLHGVCRAGIGRTFQVVRIFSHFNLLENVVLGALCAHRDDASAYDAARVALTRVAMVEHESSSVTSLTTLQLRLMELARAIVSKPRLLLLDEILAGLGAEEVEHVLKVINDLREDGITIVIIEHTMQAMVRLADRLLVLDHGGMLVCGEPASVTSNPRVIEAYLGKRWVAHAAH